MRLSEAVRKVLSGVVLKDLIPIATVAAAARMVRKRVAAVPRLRVDKRVYSTVFAQTANADPEFRGLGG